ncbi:MAG: type I-B CRISPR-associated protein Cas8b1/Cst1, partial [Anaerolineae bacterium]|nr:type I-B CRISPR-associated protein Cas8b1/Cst1 [Anaerolineae bacterium]
KAVQNYISTIFTNSHFVQPAKSTEDKEHYADEILFAFSLDKSHFIDANCIFFPELPAIMFAHRQHIPLLNGEDIRNFSPYGTRGIPVSGLALLAIHAMPMGCFRYGNYLAFHQLAFEGQTNPAMMGLLLADQAWRANDKAIQMASQSNGKINLGRYQKTRYVDELVKVARSIRQRKRSADFNNITGYYFTNYGPAPDIQMMRLDNLVLSFLQAVEATESVEWRRVVAQGWERPKEDTGSVEDEQTRQTWRNHVYEGLFELPDRARQFIKNHLSHGGWGLIEIFLRKVMQMEQERIDTYRTLGDQLGEYMLAYEAPSLGFYHGFARAEKYAALRSVIRRADEKMMKAGEPEPIFTYERFILAFETPSAGY